jgi:PAS domain S-box-containing protein
VPYKAAVRSLPFSVALVDQHIKFDDASDAFLAMFARTRDQIIGRYVYDVFPAPSPAARDEDLELYRRVIHDGETIQQPEYNYPIDGDDRWWRITRYRVQGENGQPHALILSENITNLVVARRILHDESLTGQLDTLTTTISRLRELLA